MTFYRVALCTILLCGSAHAVPLYSVTALNKLPDAIDSRAFGLNNVGQVVGDSRHDRSGHIGQARPVLWDSSSVPVELWNGPLVGGSAADINNSRVVVGRYGSGSGTPLPGPGVPFGRGFVWDSTGGRRDLGLEPVGNTQAVAINDAGQVVGTSEVLMDIDGSNFFIPRAFVWDDLNGIHDIGTLGGFGAFANDNNELGQVVGYSDTPEGFSRAYIWDAENSMRDLGTLTGTGSNRARAINDVGQVVGFESGEGGFIWDQVSGLQPMGLGNPYDINNSGQVVGGGGLIWDSINGTRDLADLIPPGLDWQFEFAFAINDAGDIVGVGTLNGEIRGFLLTPIPEPQTAMLVVLAFLSIVIVHRKNTF